MPDPTRPSPTSLLRITGASLLIVGCAGSRANAPPPTPPDPRIARHLAIADDVARWLATTAEPTAHGVRWPIDPSARRRRYDTTLYHGSAGVVVFLLAHHAATGKRESLQLATRGARDVWQRTEPKLDRMPPGLYSGLAGIAWSFAELYRSTGQARHRDWARQCCAALARREGRNLATDIISGQAGIGVTALRLSRDPALTQAGRDALSALAVRTGDALLRRARAIPAAANAPRAAAWKIEASYPREMPNFSHGTAGVSFFLAELHRATGTARFLAGAQAGAEHLLAVGNAAGLVHHNDGNRDLHYLSWCHGPPGTARLFHSLFEQTGAPRLQAWVRRATKTLLASGIPQRKHPGFWNNHGQCCGTAGIVDFYLDLARRGETRAPAAVDAALDALIAASVVDADGRRWTGAEHRVRPKLLSTQTGYTQGAAGIGLLFLHDVARRRGTPRRIVLPDAAPLRAPGS